MVKEAAFKQLRASLRGDVLTPADAGYDASRQIFNTMIDRHPAIIARCADAADVVTCVGFAHAQGLEVSVCGGGHSVAGKAVCDGALMIDLATMKGSASIRSTAARAPSPDSGSASSTAPARSSAWPARLESLRTPASPA